MSNKAHPVILMKSRYTDDAELTLRLILWMSNNAATTLKSSFTAVEINNSTEVQSSPPVSQLF